MWYLSVRCQDEGATKVVYQKSRRDQPEGRVRHLLCQGLQGSQLHDIVHGGLRVDMAHGSGPAGQESQHSGEHVLRDVGLFVRAA